MIKPVRELNPTEAIQVDGQWYSIAYISFDSDFAFVQALPWLTEFQAMPPGNETALVLDINGGVEWRAS